VNEEGPNRAFKLRKVIVAGRTCWKNELIEGVTSEIVCFAVKANVNVTVRIAGLFDKPLRYHVFGRF
jgi:hypothetical protein